MKSILFYSFVLLLFSCSGSKEKFLHPDSVSSEMYEVLLEIDFVKVILTAFKPCHGDKIHDHNTMTFYLLKGGKAKVVLPDGSVNEGEIPSGFTAYDPKEQRHQVTNAGDNQVKILLVEHS